MVAVGELQIDFTPPWLKNFAITKFGSDDKLILVGGILVVIALFAAVIGVAATRRLWVGMAGLAVFAVIGLTAAATRPTASFASLLPTVAATAAAAAVLRILIPLVGPAARHRPATWTADPWQDAWAAAPDTEVTAAGPAPEEPEPGTWSPGTGVRGPGVRGPESGELESGDRSPGTGTGVRGLAEAGPAPPELSYRQRGHAGHRGRGRAGGPGAGRAEQRSQRAEDLRIPKPTVSTARAAARCEPGRTGHFSVHHVQRGVLPGGHGDRLAAGRSGQLAAADPRHGRTARSRITFDELLKRPLIEDYVTLVLRVQPGRGPLHRQRAVAGGQPGQPAARGRNQGRGGPADVHVGGRVHLGNTGADRHGRPGRPARGSDERHGAPGRARFPGPDGRARPLRVRVGDQVGDGHQGHHVRAATTPTGRSAAGRSRRPSRPNAGSTCPTARTSSGRAGPR